MTNSRQTFTSSNWFSRASAGTFGGLGIAVGLMGLIGRLCHIGGAPFAAGPQLLMWMVSPVWVLILGFCFFFRTGKQAWAMLGLANLILWSGFMLARSLTP